MSFSLTDKKKINLIRKSVQAISFAQDDFYLQLHHNKIRFMSSYGDSNFIADISNTFFHKFKPLEDLMDSADGFIQLKINRDQFLRCFNIQDDREVEFVISFINSDSGYIQILKTRDTFTVETQLMFEVLSLSEKEKEIYELEYIFPPENLLVNTSFRQFRNIKNIFKTKMKAEIIKMCFKKSEISLTGEFNSKLSLQLQTKDFDNYLGYANLEGEFIKGEDFEIKIPLRFLGIALKISEMMESQFQMAMEQVSSQYCNLYLISEDVKGNYNFCIESRSIGFEDKNPRILEESYPKQVKTPRLDNPLSAKKSKKEKLVPELYKEVDFQDEDEEMKDDQQSNDNEEQDNSGEEQNQSNQESHSDKKESSDEEMTRDEQKEVKKSIKKIKQENVHKNDNFYNELDKEEFF